MKSYGIRKCLTCGKDFEALSHSVCYCSKECRHVAKLQSTAESHRRANKRRKEEVARLRAELALALELNKELSVKLEEFLAAAKSEGKPLDDIEEFIRRKGFQKCLRSEARGTSLPCGKNVLCWQDSPCERTAGMEKPRMDLMAGRNDAFYIHASK